MSDSTEPLKILLVENNQVNQLVATAMLVTQGYLIDVAENGIEGVKATHEIRALDGDKSSVPIIAVTAHAMHGDRETYLAAGMNDYVSKPIDPKLLLDAIHRWSGKPGTAVATPTDGTPAELRARTANG